MVATAVANMGGLVSGWKRSSVGVWVGEWVGGWVGGSVIIRGWALSPVGGAPVNFFGTTVTYFFSRYTGLLWLSSAYH